MFAQAILPDEGGTASNEKRKHEDAVWRMPLEAFVCGTALVLSTGPPLLGPRIPYS